MNSTGLKPRRWGVVCLFGFLGLATAQKIRAACAGPRLITAEAEISSFSECYTITGDFTVQSVTVTATASSGQATGTLPFDVVKHVVGSLEFIDNVAVSESQEVVDLNLALPELMQVDGALTFKNMPLAGAPFLQVLQTADTISFSNVSFPNIEAEFTSGYYLQDLESVHSLNFSDCRGLTAIGPLPASFSVPQVYSQGGGLIPTTVTISGNQDLLKIDLNGYHGARTDLYIQDNNPNVNVSTDMVTGSIRLQAAQAFTADGLTTLLPFPGESTSNPQSISNTKIKALSFSQLTEIQGATLKISGNIYLDSLEMPILQNATGLEIVDNSKLTAIALDSLSTVQTLWIEGPVTSISLNNLTNPDQIGQVTIKPDDNSVCSAINLPRSQYKCGSGTGSPSKPHQSGSSEPKSSSGGLSTGAKIGIGVGVGVGVLAIAAAVFFFWCCTRRNKQHSREDPSATKYFTTDPKPVERSASRYTSERSPGQYTKVSTYGPSEDRKLSEERVSPSSGFDSRLGDNWSPPERSIPTADGRIELEEQQGPRHEMDARSLHDMEMNDDREETRSLEDIERAHGERP